MIDDETAARLHRHWVEGWNGEDLDVIMAPFSPDIVFRSPGVALVTGDPDATAIVGADQLRAYCDQALRRTPGIRYTVHSTYTGTDGIVLVYTAHLPSGREHHGADSMRVDETGAVVEWTCHYSAAL